MKVLIDTNIIMDVLENRIPHMQYSERAFDAVAVKGIGFITSAQTKDIFYFLEKSKGL